MCDTVVALGTATADGSVIFAKNSDREPNEAHQILALPRARHLPGTTTRCTYITIPQVEETYAVLLAKPFWIWGAEMGANEHGVVIGNEAIITRVSLDREPGLIGMDFIRLALERAATARAALDVITALLAAHGQGGNCGFTRPSFYHNSFLIADPHEAWVLESAGRQWAAERVQSVRAISNAISIGNRWDLASPGLVDYAVEQGWCTDPTTFDFGQAYSDPHNPRLVSGIDRQCRAMELLETHSGQITTATMMALLRDHGADAD